MVALLQKSYFVTGDLLLLFGSWPSVNASQLASIKMKSIHFKVMQCIQEEEEEEEEPWSNNVKTVARSH